jgi:hypothetical protein
MITRSRLAPLRLLLIPVVLGAALSGCGSGGGVYYTGHYGYNPWRHDRYYDRPIYVGGGRPVLPDDRPVAVPLPEPPMEVPDFGMPDMEMGGGFDIGPDF